MDYDGSIKKYWEGVSLEAMQRSLINRYLKESGWLESATEKMPLREGEPVPWYTYSAIAFLEQIISSRHKVFEFGAGNSTIYWEKRVRKVVSCEHDPAYVAYLQAHSMCKAEIILVSDCSEVDADHIIAMASKNLPSTVNRKDAIKQVVEEGYSHYGSTICDFPDGHFDIAVVDGAARTLSALHAGLHMVGGGLVLLDNSERPESSMAITILTAMGFRRIDFWGLGPVNPYGWCTTMFFKDGPGKCFF